MRETSQNADHSDALDRLRRAGAKTGLLAWALGIAAVLSALLLARGAVSSNHVIALLLIAAPALVGAVGEPGQGGRATALAAWAAAAACAAWASGGFASPLALLCLLPSLGAILLDATASEAAGAGVGATVLLTLGSLLFPPPSATPVGETDLMAFLLLGLSAVSVTAALATRSRPIPAVSPRDLRGAASSAGVGRAAASPALAERLQTAEAARQDAEAARARAEADVAARAMFLANMSHELRTPLNAIMGFSDMMRARMFGPMAAKYGEYADLIHESGEHLLDLINDILDMSKIEADRYALHPETFDARTAVNAAMRLMRVQAENGGVHLRSVLPDEPLMATADLRAFKQIILNLLSNAVKFTPPAGSVIIRLAAVGDALELVVADTGIGIAPEDLKRLGRPFEQAGGARDRARGSGLGLALVAALARLHGGELTLESRLGDGTAATVRLPVLSEGASAPLDAAAPAGAAGGVSLTAARGAPPLEPELDDARSQTVSPNGASANIRETTAEWKRLERPSAKIVRLPPIRLPPPPPRSEG